MSRSQSDLLSPADARDSSEDKNVLKFQRMRFRNKFDLFLEKNVVYNCSNLFRDEKTEQDLNRIFFHHLNGLSLQ